MRTRYCFAAVLLVATSLACGRSDVAADGNVAVPDGQSTLGAPRTPPDPSRIEAPEAPGRWADLGDSYILPAPPQFGSLEALALPQCSRQSAVISRDSLGPLALAFSVTDFFAFCPSAPRRWIPDGEGGVEPGTYVRLGESVLEVVFYDTLPASQVRRIDVGDSLAHFQSGLRAGASLQRAAHELGRPHAVLIECGLWVSFANAPGVAAWVSVPGEPDCLHRGDVERAINSGRIDISLSIAGFRLFRPGT